MRVVFDKNIVNVLKDKAQTKRPDLTEYLADVLLNHFLVRMIVALGAMPRCMDVNLSARIAIHSHEKADTLILLDVLDTFMIVKRNRLMFTAYKHVFCCY